MEGENALIVYDPKSNELVKRRYQILGKIVK
jgi:hypothetical protein